LLLFFKKEVLPSLTLPLTGLLVISVEQAVAAPYAACKLADAGARVIKIERPEGDFARGYDSVVHGESTYFVWLNRGKESVVLDYRIAADAALLRRMMLRADVVIQNLGPGAAERAGFGWRELRAAKPSLITCDITGYGESGPFADQRAYDLLVQAESGMSSITGTPHAPGRIGVSACDIATGMNAHAAILEALIRRGMSGQGAAIQVSLFESMADWMNVPILFYEHTGTQWPRLGLGHPSMAPYGVFDVSDGQILVGVQNDREWRRVCIGVLEQPGLAEDPRFVTNAGRVRNRAALEAIVRPFFAALSARDLVALLTRAEVAFGRLNDVAAVSRHEQLRRTEVATAGGPVSLVAPAASFREEPRRFGPVPALGAHTEAVRAEFAEP